MVRRTLARVAGFGLCLVALVSVRPMAAQTGSAVDVLTGTVTDSLGNPVMGAAVEAYAIESQVTRKTTTNNRGRYTIFFNDGGGQYRLTVTMIGKQPFIANVTRQSDDDRIMVDVKMGDRPVVLQDIVARGNRQQVGGRDAPTPGSTERNFTAEQLLRLPVDASDLAALAALVPGVIVTQGNDSTATQFSIAGQGGAANSYTVDGLSFGGDALPQDAIRNTRVVTNTYDVARGQFSGGLVSASTRGGSNAVQGSLSGNLRDYHLAFGGTDDVFSRGQSSQRLGFGFGGPIVRDKFFAFASLQLDRSMSPVATLSSADAVTSGRLGIAADSVVRFIDLVNSTGLTTLAGPIDPNRNNDRYSGLMRLDWNPSDAHTFTLRGDLRINSQEPNRVGTTQLSQVGGVTEGSGGGIQLSVFSRLGASLTNEFRAGWSTDESLSSPFLFAPSGRVQNLSVLDDGSISSTVLGFGGNSGLPQETRSSNFELTEEVSFFSPTAAHRYRIGVLFNTSSFTQDVTTNRFGTYSYESLADLEANTPSQFTRTLSPTIRDGSGNNAAMFISDVWRPTSNLQLTMGGRLERSWYSGAPERNAVVEERFGVRTDVLPEETAFSPRLGFSYSIAAAEQRGQSQRGFAPPLLTIRGGVGLFRGTMTNSIPGTAQAQSGLVNTESQLICVGDAVPVADWSDFGTDPLSIPTACLGANTPARTGVPNITTWSGDYAAAKTWRGSLGLSKRFWNTWNATVDASYTRGIDQSASRDLNLRSTPVFSLSGEDNRPVYADPNQIVASTGVIPLSASRVDEEFGRVNQAFSTLENSTTQFTAAVSTFLPRGATLNLSYSWMRSNDQGGSGGGRGGSGVGGAVVTAGDPYAFEWARSSGERRHNIQANIMWPFTQSLELSLVGRMQSGSHYTPMVSGDINGDGSRNDIAFIYDPTTAADPEVAAGMERLLSTLDGSARECLASQLGGVAGRNSCTGPWQPSLDLQLNWRPGMFDNRLAISFSTINFLGGLDELLHGADGIKGWGGFARPDANLLQVTGYDPQAARFTYAVNERFGATSSGATAVRSPFQVGVQMRYTIGQDRMREMRRNFFGGGANGQPNLATQMLARFDSLAPNVAKAALARKDSLVLSPQQIVALQALVDSSASRTKPALDSLRLEVEKAGTNPDMSRLFPLLGEVQRVTMVDRDSTIAATRRILTDAQWALIPEAIRNPPQNPFMGRGPGGVPGAGGPPGAGGGRPGMVRGGRDGGE